MMNVMTIQRFRFAIQSLGIMGMILFLGMSTSPLFAQQTEADVQKSLALFKKSFEQNYPTAQELRQTIQLDLTNVSVEEALVAIAEKANLKLMYSKTLLPPKKGITISRTSITLYEALWKVLEDTGLRFALSQNKQLVLLKMQQEKKQVQRQESISGTVTDASTGEPLPGVNILVKGTTTGASTDGDGNFELTAPSLQDTLVVTYIGYQRQEVAIDGRTEVNIQLTSETIMGEEMVVVGYGEEKEKHITSSITHIDDQEFNTGQISNPAGLIQGKVAGLQIAKAGSDPNGAYNIQLRGINTLGENSDPLIVLNGVPGATLSNIDPNDIESIDVLKDASASAIYGTQGANGVILVSTKTGSSSSSKPEFNVSYKGQVTMGIPTRTLNVMNADQYRNFLVDYEGETGSDLTGSDLGYSTDWIDEITRNSMNYNQHLSLSGGTNNTNYRASVNYRKREGILKKSGHESTGMFLSLNQSTMDDKLQVNLNFSGHKKDINYGFPEAIRYASIFNPTAPIHSDEPRFKKWGGYFQQEITDYNNPLAIVEQNENNGNNTYLSGSARAVYNFEDYIPGFSASVLYSEKNDKTSHGIYHPKTDYFRGYENNGLASHEVMEKNSRTFQSLINYNRSLTNSLDIKVMGGYSWQIFTNEGSNIEGGGFLTDYFGYHNMSASQDFNEGIGNVGSYKNSNKLIAGFGRVNLRFKDTYLLTGSLRREGSSRFGINNKWGTFYSISGGIRLAELLNIDNAQQLKLRLGYGVTGNNAPENYISKLTYTNRGFFWESGEWMPTYGPDNNPNPNLKWEKKVAFNLGVDFSFFKNRLGGSIDIYSNKTKDLLLNFNVPVPPNIFDTQWINIGELSNKGVELVLNYDVFRSKNLHWSTGIVGSIHNRTKIVSLSNENIDFGNQQIIAQLGSPGQVDTKIIRVKEGEPIGQIWGPVFKGISDDGKWILEDLDNDGTIGKSDNKVIGNGQPMGSLGWKNNFNYKNWGLDLFFQGTVGHDLVNVYRSFYEIPSRIGQFNILESSQNVKNLTAPARFSSLYVENASFLRLRNLSLNYMVPVKAKALSSINLSLGANNLFTLTNFSGPDPSPRYSDRGNPLAAGIARRDTYFNSRSFTFTIDLKF